jgi:tetratricopeptide (TPR) repeat protein
MQFMKNPNSISPQTKVAFLLMVMLLCSSVCLVGQSSIDKGKALYESRKYPEAEKILKTVSEETSEYATAQYYLGRIAFDKGAFDDAVDYFEEATEGRPNISDYFNRLGDSYAAAAKNANMFRQGILGPKAKDAWEKAVELDSKNIEARISLVKFYKYAPGFMGGGMNKAKAMATEIMKLNPAEGHWQMGSLFAHEKNTPEAEKEFSKMLKADPGYSKNLAVYYTEQKQYDKAFELFEDALKKNPDDYSSLYQLGKAAALSGSKLDRGEECLKKYLNHTPAQNEPSIGGAYMRLAQIKEKKGSKSEAKKYFEMALKQDDGLKEAKEGLERTSK